MKLYIEKKGILYKAHPKFPTWNGASWDSNDLVLLLEKCFMEKYFSETEDMEQGDLMELEVEWKGVMYAKP